MNLKISIYLMMNIILFIQKNVMKMCQSYHLLNFKQIQYISIKLIIGIVKIWTRLSCYHYSRSVATCKEMLISGVGVTILPEIMMKNIDHVFEFEKVNIDGLPLIRSTYMSYDSSILQLPQVDAFVSLMLNFTK